METWPERSLHALAVYFERGEKALVEMSLEHYDEADELLNKRKAAFHNFKAADHLARKAGYPDEIAKKLEVLWPKLAEQDEKLMKELVIAKDKLGKQLVQLGKAKLALKNYRSNENDGSWFEKSV